MENLSNINKHAFIDFLREQELAYKLLKEQYPNEHVDLYRGRIEDLLANLKVLMYYQITPKELDGLLKLKKAHRNFKLLNEDDLDLDAYGKMVENLQTLLYKHGQLNTFRENKPFDSDGQPIPWITYPALEFLSQLDYSDCNLFEFGAGNSTLYWARRAREVISVETDLVWFESLNYNKPENVRLFHEENESKFAGLILDFDCAFDVIVIDSIKYRYSATLNAIKTIAAGGLIIFDNSDWYPNSCKLLTDAGFCQIDFNGFGPVNGYAWTTSLFFNGNIRLKRVDKLLRPVGGIDVHLEDDTPVGINQ